MVEYPQVLWNFYSHIHNLVAGRGVKTGQGRD